MLEETDYLEHCNIFAFINKDECLLFDCGVGLANIKQYLQSLGINKFKVILTHSHFDHVGGLIFFEDSEVFALKLINDHLMDNNLGLDYLVQKDFRTEIEYRSVIDNFNTSSYLCQLVTSEILEIGNYKFKTINLPGHSKDSYVYYDETNGFMISGDVLYRGNLYYADENRQTYLKTLKIFLNFDISILFPGHNEIIKGKESISSLIYRQIKELTT